MKGSAEESATAPKKMSFTPGWARGSSSAGLVRSASLQGTTGISKPPSLARENSLSGVLPSGGPGGLGAGAFAPMGGKSAAAALTADRRSLSSTGDMTANSGLATLGRVPGGGAGRAGGKLTEQAILFQQTKSPRSPPGGTARSGAPKVRYSREEMLLCCSDTVQPDFPMHVNPGLITGASQRPSLHEPFENREALYRDWQTECEKRNVSHAGRGTGHMANGALSADRRSSRGRRSDNMIGEGVPMHHGAGAGPGMEGRPGPSSAARGFAPSAGGSWRTGGTGVPPGKDGLGQGSGRFGGGMRNDKDHSRWSNPPAAAAGGRWSNLPTSTERRDREANRWDRTARPEGRTGTTTTMFGRGGTERAQGTSSGDPVRDSMADSRWRRNNERVGSAAFGDNRSDRGTGDYFGHGQQQQQQPHGGAFSQQQLGQQQFRGGDGRRGGDSSLLDDDSSKDTFSDAALAGSGLGLESMAAASERFAQEMEASRQRSQNGGAAAAGATGGLRDSPGLRPGSNLLGLMGHGGHHDDILNAPLESDRDHPPEESVMDPSHDHAQPHLHHHQQQPPLPDHQATSGWSVEPANPWMSAAGSSSNAQSLPQQASGGGGGWVVPPPNSQQVGGIPPLPLAQQPPAMFPGAPPVHAPLPDEWYYQDPQGNVQGPFKSEEMREWLEHGYFDEKLMIRRGQGSEPFTPLGQRFIDARKAFTSEADREEQMLALQRPMLLPQSQQVLPQGGFWPAINPVMQQQQQHQMQMQQHQQQQQQAAEEQLKREEEQKRLEEARGQALREEESRQNLNLLMEQQRQQQEQEEMRRQKEEEERKRKEEELRLEELRKEQEAARLEAERAAADEAERERQRAAAEERVRQEQLEQQRQQLLAQQQLKQEQQLLAQQQQQMEEEEERRKAEEKPAWGGVAAAPTASMSKLSLKEIQEMEEREAMRRGTAPAAQGGPLSMAARIAQAAGVSAPRLNSHGSSSQSASAPVASGAQTSGNAVPLTQSAATDAVEDLSESSAPVNAYGSTLNDMSVDLRAMLGVGSGGAGSGKRNSGSNKSAESAKPAWGNAAQPAKAGKSLKQIQEEEARRLRAQQQQQSQQQQQQQQQQSPQPKSSGGGWSKSGSSTAQLWEFETANSGRSPTQAAAQAQLEAKGWTTASRGGRTAAADNAGQSTTNARAAQQQQQQQQTGNRRGVQQQASAQQQQRQQQQQQMYAAAFAVPDAENFGGKTMSSDMRKWCEGQVQKLGATMTLIEFCYTLEDPSDIREYLRDYLGSTPQVSAFASEFIQRKSGKAFPGTEDGADASGFIPAKKGKKKKKIAGQ